MMMDLIFFLAPVAGVLPFFFTERWFVAIRRPTRQILTLLSIALLNQVVALILSSVALVPLVFFLSPLQVCSISDWETPQSLRIIAGILLLDLGKYADHRLHHAIPVLWRFHRLHHADQTVDTLTSILHHPLEVASAFFLTITVAVLADVPVFAIVIYGLMMVFHSAVVHSGLLIPEQIDNALSKTIVTPSFHRIHHSSEAREAHANFGSIFTLWDHVFATTVCKSKSPLQTMEFGIADVQAVRISDIRELLIHPFISPSA